VKEVLLAALTAHCGAEPKRRHVRGRRKLTILAQPN
jgi:hypothetical protein